MGFQRLSGLVLGAYHPGVEPVIESRNFLSQAHSRISGCTMRIPTMPTVSRCTRVPSTPNTHDQRHGAQSPDLRNLLSRGARDTLSRPQPSYQRRAVACPRDPRTTRCAQCLLGPDSLRKSCHVWSFACLFRAAAHARVAVVVVGRLQGEDGLYLRTLGHEGRCRLLALWSVAVELNVSTSPRPR